PTFARLLASIGSDYFCPDEPGLFRDVFNELSSPWDPYVHFADLGSYIAAKRRIASDYTNRAAWNRRAILNVARVSKFSSDRTVTEYAKDIWNIQAVKSGDTPG